MNKSNAHLFLPLVKALSEGETIQLSRHEDPRHLGMTIWDNCAHDVDFEFKPERYRVKPRPVEISVWVNGNGDFMANWSQQPDTLAAAGFRLVRMREIT